MLSNPQNEVGDGMLLTAARRKVTKRREEVMTPEEEVESRRLQSPLFDEKIPTQWELHRDVF